VSGQPLPIGRHIVDVPQVLHSWSGGQATAPQQLEPGAVQNELPSHARQTWFEGQATAPQQDDPDGLQTGSPPQLSSIMPRGQSPRAGWAAPSTPHVTIVVRISTLATDVIPFPPGFAARFTAVV
jgi:hypothetical protein